MSKRKTFVETATETAQDDVKNKTVATETTQDISEDSAPRKRRKRKVTYERVSETDLPQELVDHFLADNYALRWVRWCINGIEDNRYLAKREREGYEFVTIDEIPSDISIPFEVRNTRNSSGIITIGDVCLMKLDVDLKKSRDEYYQNLTDKEVSAVDINVLRSRGFRDMGTKSSISTSVPSFKD